MTRLVSGLALAGAVTAVWGGMAGVASAAQPTPWAMWLQEPASPIMEMINRFNTGITIAMIAVVLVVLALLIYVMVRFNAKANPVPSKTSHNTMIEVVWTVAPILILIAIAVPSFSLLFAQQDPGRILKDYDPAKVLTVKATGIQWYWNYEYPDNDGVAFDSNMLTDDQRTDPANQPRLLAVDNEMIVPVGTVVRMQVIGQDVIHSFTVPAFGIKIDAIPGRLNETWFLAEREGVYYGQCSELCGINHAFMPIAVRVVKPEQFKAWAIAAKTDLPGAYKALTASIQADMAKVADAGSKVEVAAR
ncbi:cytochrome c oxidase subunit II [Kaistia algarum]|uniref:cytochrome c oxidase subunit II n=1 Tax=Kaistia algarum TaxID=2083279 RepID=UPI000CE831C3|nr:cytochrome c oxidase subunit II [Kaistia algarum]MCX5512387.1 cytochrome c oxidase subunit II [Kaistia algarum]PPE80617.1 cytochrome c oxidase subunit II [Kaistia algarum]